MLIDTHVHVWDLDANPFGVDYPWLTSDLDPLYRTYALTDVGKDMDAAGVDGVVLVQASDSLAETEALLAAAGANVAVDPQRAVRVVGWLPLADAKATELELERRSGSDALVGVRHLIHDEPDREWLLRPDVADGMRVLERAGLTFDAVAERPDLMAQVPVVAERHAGLTVVLDHLGKPPIASRDVVRQTAWERLIRSCGSVPNVVAKISGLNTASRPDWTVADWRPWVDVALDAFGPERLMVGSDWPVALRAGSYASVTAALLDVLDGLTAGERRQILLDTPARVYGFSGEDRAVR